MQCFRPLAAWQPLRGEKRALQFTDPSIHKSDMPFRRLNVPCGRCTGCRLEQSRQWAVRIMHECSMHEQNCFITLTYDDANLPLGGTLVKKHLTDFFKRLRYHLEPTKIRYFAVGEYGEKTNRPHYHAILFGTDFSHDRKLYKQRAHPLYQSPTLSAAWPYGFANFGSATFESAAYVARYCLKKVNRKGDSYEIYCDIKTGEVVSRIHEYSVMSRRPGIGIDFYDKYSSDILRTDKVILRGEAMRPPRYYDKLSAELNPQYFEEIKNARLTSDCTHHTIDDAGDARMAERARQLLQSAIRGENYND